MNFVIKKGIKTIIKMMSKIVKVIFGQSSLKKKDIYLRLYKKRLHTIVNFICSECLTEKIIIPA